MAERQQMLGGDKHPVAFINADGSGVRSDVDLIEVDGRGAAGLEQREGLSIVLGGHLGDAGDTEGEHLADGCALLVGGEVSGGEGGFVATETCLDTEGLGDLREERVQEIRDDDADDLGAATRQVAGENVWRVADLSDDVENTLPCLRANVRFFVQTPETVLSET